MSNVAQDSDYKNIQGGKPQVWRNPRTGLWHILHDYLDEPVEIITHISPLKRGKVTLSDGKEYEVALLFEFEGKPCQTESFRSKGEGYGTERG